MMFEVFLLDLYRNEFRENKGVNTGGIMG